MIKAALADPGPAGDLPERSAFIAELPEDLGDEWQHIGFFIDESGHWLSTPVRLQAQIAEAGMIIRPAPQRPVEFAVCLFDRQIVDAGEAPLHQPLSVEFPILIAVGTKPVAAVVMPFIGEANSDPVAGEGPELLDQPVIKFFRPFAGEEGDNLLAAGDEFGPVPPLAVRRVDERDLLRVTAVPAIFRQTDFGGGGFCGEREVSARSSFGSSSKKCNDEFCID